MMAAEVAGPRGKASLASLARQEGETASAFEGRLSTRAIDRPQRMMDAFEKATGVAPDAAMGDIEALVSKGQESVKPLFDAARASPVTITSDRLSAIADTPAGKKALRLAGADVMNNVDGPGAEALGLEVRGMTPEGLPESVALRNPTLETWDKVYKALGKAVERNQFGKIIPDSQSPGNYNINSVRRALRAELEKVSPEWGQAMAGSADYMQSQAAFDNAQKMLFSPRVSASQFGRHVAGLGKGEAQAAKAGAANAIFDLAQKGRLKPGALKTPIIRDKLRALLGPDGADMIANMVRDEDVMRVFEQRSGVSAGSHTFDLLAAKAEQDAVHPVLKSAANATVATMAMGPVAGKAVILRALANAVGDRFKTGGMSVRARDAAGKALMMPPGQFANALASAPVPPRPVLNALRRGAHGSLTRSGRLAGILAGQAN